MKNLRLKISTISEAGGKVSSWENSDSLGKLLDSEIDYVFRYNKKVIMIHIEEARKL